ncbi:hypothetical protein OV450_8154 [Actinobacteria bacterium OV450]|nr:hypothetical protein OV450_8154 [Actinobacteria bacterium OV450]
MANRSELPRSTEDRLAVIDALAVRPYPVDGERRTEDGGWSGPGHHVAVLAESRDFWDDRDEELVEAAEQETAAALAALAEVLTGRWGAPETVDLWPYLGLDAPDADVAAPEPLLFLSGVAGSMQVWRPGGSGRWIALAVGQADAEWPFQLLAAFGEEAALTPGDAPPR